jgi:quinol monooxygenase YgiN
MWMHITKITTVADKADELIALISNDELVRTALASGKLHQAYVLQSPKESGEILSVSVWQDVESGTAFFQGEAYAELGQQMRSYLLAPPERAGYEVNSMMFVHGDEVLRYP